ncbi:MAG: serine--tRNA ligase [Patescibacteria group bacterium]|jgi:seryl-tRNA synthetase
MLDIKYIRDHLNEVKQAIKNKNSTVNIEEVLKKYDAKRELQKNLDDLNQQRNAFANQGKKNKPTPDQIELGKNLKQQASKIEEELRKVEHDYQVLMYQVPNVPTQDTPVGADESGNVMVREWGTQPQFDFTPKPHWELGKALDVIDNEAAARVSGARFTYLKKELALMEYALVQLAFSVTLEQGFIPVIPPIFIKPDVFEKMGRLHPAAERYYIPSDDLYLIGSAEHTLGSIHLGEIIPEAKLPLRYIAFSPALRREAGAASKDTRGILRLHQFHKIEMEVFSTPEQGMAEHNLLVSIEETLLQKLNLPYQVLLKCTGDIGDPNARGMDINTWMPGQGVYRETHTADYMTDYQARRLNTRYRQADGSTNFVHMNDATALAIGRIIAAIMENYQQADGTIIIPEVLHPWMFNHTRVAFAA